MLLFYGFLRGFVGHTRREGEGVDIEVVGVDDATEFGTPVLQGLDVVALVFQLTTKVGDLFGRTYTTVMHGCANIEENEELKKQAEEIIKLIT